MFLDFRAVERYLYANNKKFMLHDVYATLFNLKTNYLIQSISVIDLVMYVNIESLVPGGFQGIIGFK